MIDVKLKGINKVKKVLASGEVRYFYYHRATKTRLPDNPHSQAFVKAFSDADEKIQYPERNRGTLKELITLYMRSPDYLDKRERTRRDYQKQITKIENKFGEMPKAALNDHRVRSDFMAWRDDLAKSSQRQADYAITVLGIILSWSMDRGYISFNHAARPRKTYKSNRASKVWSEDNVQKFIENATSNMKEALILARDTGQRQGDLLRLSWNAYDGTFIKLTQSKTGSQVEIPVTIELKNILDAKKAIGMSATTILTRPDGQPWKTDHFRHAWREVTKEAGLDGLTFNDLRGTAVTALADAQCTTIEIASITGHSLKSVEAILEHYVARTRTQARSAIHKLENARRTNSANQSANQAKNGQGGKP